VVGRRVGQTGHFGVECQQPLDTRHALRIGRIDLRPVPAHPSIAPGSHAVLRHFTVAVFVVYDGQVLLHYHRKLGKWLPPGGHIEDNELPDDAARREVLEETGLRVRLVGGRGLPLELSEPRQLVVPAGVQVESIYPGHQHIDLVYFAVPDPYDPRASQVDPRLAESDQVGWHAPQVVGALGASDEIAAWARRAVDELSARQL
jgi:8-oxo-dGTP pyrophosphatase MutT (NUDIX family)